MMNAASFFSLEAPAGATVPAGADETATPESSLSGNADAFAALVDEAFVRTTHGQVELPVLELVAKPAATGPLVTAPGAKSPELAAEEVSVYPDVEEEKSSPAAEPSKPEKAKPEPLPGLDILLLSQSFFVAPTLPVTWVVPPELPAESGAKSGDERAPAVESALQSESRPASERGRSAQGWFEQAPGVRTETQELPAPLTETAALMRTVVAPEAVRESAKPLSPQPASAQSGQAESSRPISGTAQTVHRDNVGRLDLAELGFQPSAGEDLPPLTKSSDDAAPPVSPTTVAPSNLPELASPKMAFEVQSNDDAAWPKPLAESSANPPESHQQAVLSSPVEKVTLPASARLPDLPAVTSNALRFATVPVVPVETLPVVAEQKTPAIAATESELPIESLESAIVAQSSPEVTVARSVPQKSQRTSKAPADAGLFKVGSAPTQVPERRGTPVAKEELRMESFSNAEQAGTGPVTGGTGDVTEESPTTGTGPMLRDRDADIADFSRNVGATDWQTGRPVSFTDRLAPDSHAVRGPEAARTVEQLSGLVMRETAVLKQHTPDSMAVVLRPDANTELFLHLTQRDGQIEASVRCERGNFDQINALWPQLQESLAGQKVRLAPLQESTEPQRDPQGASGSTMNFSESEQRSRRQSMPEDDSTSDRPSSAPPSTVSLHPERRRSGTRPTASRPGWETWA